MRYCPICDARYDDETIKFCTKDGTPLVEDNEPNFATLPSEETDDEIGQETVIRRREDMTDASTKKGERIVIPAVDEPASQQVRPRTAQAYYPPPPPPPNTGKTIVLTILGTLAVLGFGAGLFWLLQKEPVSNVNVNTNMPNVNVNLNSNGFDSNFNFNQNANFATNYNFNTNLNANIKTPTPTPTPKPSPSATVSPSPSPSATATPRPSPSPTRPATNTPRSTPAPTPREGPRPPRNN